VAFCMPRPIYDGRSKRAAILLEPFAAADRDATFLETFADALMRSGKPDPRARNSGRLVKEKNQGLPAFSTWWTRTPSWARLQISGRSEVDQRPHVLGPQQNDFRHAAGIALAENTPTRSDFWSFCGAVLHEANRETQYFEILIKLFDVYFNAGNIQKASEALERSVDIEPYEHRNQDACRSCQGRSTIHS